MRPRGVRLLLLLALLALSALALGACGKSSSGGSSSQGGAAPQAGASSGGGGPAVAAAKVTIANYKFMPASITVKAGGTVTWTNTDSDRHTASSDAEPRVFDTNTLNKGQSKAVSFKKPGTYKYLCVYHAFMQGTVVVK